MTVQTRSQNLQFEQEKTTEKLLILLVTGTIYGQNFLSYFLSSFIEIFISLGELDPYYEGCHSYYLDQTPQSRQLTEERLLLGDPLLVSESWNPCSSG